MDFSTAVKREEEVPVGTEENSTLNSPKNKYTCVTNICLISIPFTVSIFLIEYS